MKLGVRRLGAFAGVAAMVALAPGAGAEPIGSSPTPSPTPSPGSSPGSSPAYNPAPGMTEPAPPPGPNSPGPIGPSGSPTVPAAAPAGSTTLALSELGGSDTVWFDAREDITSSSISFVVPRGLTPTSLNATIELPVNLRFGSMSVTQDGRTIARLPLPAEDRAAMVIPLAGLESYDDWASVTLTVTALPVDDVYCWDPQSPLRLVNGSVTFTGQDAVPGNVADFLPPTLRRLAIAIPTNPSLAEAEAAVQLAAAMTTRYSWQNTDIVVVGLPPDATALPEPAPPRERQIVIKEGPEPGLALQPGKGLPALLITGSGAELTNQTRLLTDPSLRFALSPKAVAGPLTTEQKPVRENTTLAKLNQNRLRAESLRPEVDVKIDQSLFGQPLNDIRVHLIGSHTPLADNFNGEVTAAIGDDVVGRWPVNPEGTIDYWVDIPNKLVQRTTVLKVRVHTTGDPGRCNYYLNPMLRIDGSTEIQAKRASPPVPPGFRSLPQAVMPTVQIGIGPDTFNNTVRAARIVVGLQRNSSIPLVTKVNTLEQAIGSGESAILISPDGWDNPDLPLPFSADLGKITVEGFTEGDEATTLTLDPELKYGSLQMVFDGRRSVLVATSNAASQQLDDLLTWLAEKPNRWSALSGRAIIGPLGSAPVTVPDLRTDLPEDRPAQGGRGSGDSWIWWVAGIIAALSLAGAVVIVRRTAAERPEDTAAERPDKPAEPDAEQQP